MLPAASVKEVTYSITDTQSSCSCKQRRHSAKSNPFTIYVSYSAVNISVVARNAAGFSPAAVVSVGLIATAGHKSEYTLVRDRAGSSGRTWTFLAVASVLSHQFVTQHYWVSK